MVPIWAALLAVFLSVFYLMADVGRETKNNLQADADRWAIDMLAYAECAERYYRVVPANVGAEATVAALNVLDANGNPMYCPFGYTAVDTALGDRVQLALKIDAAKNVFVHTNRAADVSKTIRALGAIRKNYGGESSRLGVRDSTTGKRIDPFTGTVGTLDVPVEVPDNSAFIVFKGS
jgi:hypothetical protein